MAVSVQDLLIDTARRMAALERRIARLEVQESGGITDHRYVPLNPPAKIVNGAALSIGTYNYVASSYGVPEGATAVAALIGGRWSSAHNSFNMFLRAYGTSNFYAVVVGQVAGINAFCSGIVPLLSNRFTVLVQNGDMNEAYVHILGYWA
jgi:hypothetical protein